VRRRRASASRWDEDNRLALNPWAFAAVAGIVLVVAGIAVLIAVL
jgi:hypothetical protein